MVNGKSINGKVLAYLIEKFVDTLNKGAIPDLSSA